MSLVDIYKQRRRALERYVRRLLANPDEASDVAQEAFLRVYAEELGDRTPASAALLYTVARNLAISELRKRKSRATDSVGDMSSLQLISEDLRPDEQADMQEQLAAVERAMARMAPKCLEVFRLRKLQELSHAEIADQMDISNKTVERHISRALELCREELLAGARPAAQRRVV
jgi:RNA polymerase sigma factor (sigma-70 family)